MLARRRQFCRSQRLDRRSFFSEPALAASCLHPGPARLVKEPDLFVTQTKQVLHSPVRDAATLAELHTLQFSACLLEVLEMHQRDPDVQTQNRFGLGLSC